MPSLQGVNDARSMGKVNFIRKNNYLNILICLENKMLLEMTAEMILM